MTFAIIEFCDFGRLRFSTVAIFGFAILEFAILEFAILEFAILEFTILDRLRFWKFAIMGCFQPNFLNYTNHTIFDTNCELLIET